MKADVFSTQQLGAIDNRKRLHVAQLDGLLVRLVGSVGWVGWLAEMVSDCSSSVGVA